MKNRIYKSIPKYPGIKRILVLDPVTKKWVEPSRGAKFQANRRIKDANGKTVRHRLHFDSFEAAKEFNLNGRMPEPDETDELDQLDPSGMKFSDVVDLWKENSLPSRDRSTQIRYKSYLSVWTFSNVTEFKGDKPRSGETTGDR